MVRDPCGVARKTHASRAAISRAVGLGPPFKWGQEVRRAAIVTPLAQSEIDRAAAWHESRREGLGVNFFERVDEAIQRIEMNPEGYAVRYKSLRRAGLDSSRIGEYGFR